MTLDENGYVVIYKPGHKSARKDGRMFEHRYVMEQYLGRYLERGEVVYHLNKIRHDNSIDNLRLTDNHKLAVIVHAGVPETEEVIQNQIDKPHPHIPHAMSESAKQKLREVHTGKYYVDMSGRKCSVCGNDDPKQFDKTNGRPRWQKIGNQFACHNCKAKEWRSKHIESVIKTRRKHYTENKESILQRDKEYYHQNKERIILQHKEYVSRNRDIVNQRVRERHHRLKEG